MSVISGTELVIREVGRWQSTDIAFIRRVNFENSSVFDNSFDMSLLVLVQPRPQDSRGWPDPDGRFWEVEILFRRVKNLSLTICGPWDFQTPGFAIEDIRDRQWEEINLLVEDYEGLTTEQIKFGARSAEIRSCRISEYPPRSLELSREYPGVFGGTDWTGDGE